MRIRTLLLFLIGNRQAILDIAADRRSLWIGCVFVLSAGFARGYDGKDLLHEPWHLALPYAASLVSSFLLFAVLFEAAREHHWQGPGFWRSYRSFLSLFWMTAPLAWIYAIPFERFMTPLDATNANLCALGVVAAWRVALMIRAVTVLMGSGFPAAFFLVLLFADVEALIGVWLAPFPLIEAMSGVRRTPSEARMRYTTLEVGCLGILALPVLLVGSFMIIIVGKRQWKMPDDVAKAGQAPGWGLACLAGASLLVWVPVLPFTQREQLLRSQVERDLREGRIAAALAEMSAHGPDEFPPQWEPPPRIGFREKDPDLLAVMEEIAEHPPADWVRSHYLQRFSQLLEAMFAVDAENPQRGRGGSAYANDLERVVNILQELPEGVELMRQLLRREPDGFDLNRQAKDRIEWVLENYSIPADTSQRLREIVKVAAEPVEKKR